MVFFRFLIIISILFFYFVLSPVSFHVKSSQVGKLKSENNDYTMIAYRVIPSTPISFLQLIGINNIYVVLYDNNGGYLGQSSPFYFYREMDVFNSGSVLFPDEIEERGLAIVSDNELTIPLKHPKWWSRILSVFY